jgi:hypothetical protein
VPDGSRQAYMHDVRFQQLASAHLTSSVREWDSWRITIHWVDGGEEGIIHPFLNIYYSLV